MTVTAYDECLQSGHVPQDAANPRLQNLCGRCGRLREPDEMQRDVEQERRQDRKLPERDTFEVVHPRNEKVGERDRDEARDERDFQRCRQRRRERGWESTCRWLRERDGGAGAAGLEDT